MAIKKNQKVILFLVLFLGLILFLNNKTYSYFYDTTQTSGSLTAGTWEVAPKVVINEVYPNPTTGDFEKIELYNDSSLSVDLGDWTIEDGNYNPRSLAGKTILANGFLILTKGTDFTFGLNDPGDILILKKTGEAKDQVAWGNWTDGNLADNAPNPSRGQTIGRFPDGLDTDFDLLDFKLMNPSFGLANIYP